VNVHEYDLVADAIDEDHETEQPGALLAVRIMAGAAWLDGLDPDWADEIEPHRLQMSECLSCVLGQLVGDYSACMTDTLTPLRADHIEVAKRRGIRLTHPEAVAMGFDSDGNDTYRDLTKGWRALVEYRQTHDAGAANLPPGTEDSWTDRVVLPTAVVDKESAQALIVGIRNELVGTFGLTVEAANEMIIEVVDEIMAERRGLVETERRCIECDELLAPGTRADIRRCQYCAVAKHLGG
jgi:hypothetical protein